MTPSARSLARDVDREFFARELESFVPERVFDAHAHLWLADAVTWPVAQFPQRVGIAEHQQLCNDLHPGRRTAGYFLPGFSAERKELIPASNHWLAESSPVWGERHAQVSPVLVGLEHLRSLKWACWSERLGDAAVEDIFWNNAARLFELSA